VVKSVKKKQQTAKKAKAPKKKAEKVEKPVANASAAKKKHHPLFAQFYSGSMKFGPNGRYK